MIKYKTHIKTIFFVLAIAGLYGFANYRNETRKISDIQVDFLENDNLFVSTQIVDELLIKSGGNIKNKTKQNINLLELEKAVEANKMIEKAEVFQTVDGILKVSVLQRKPIARIQVNGTSYYLDSQSKKMPLSSSYSARVPIFTGIKSKPDLDLVYQFVKEVLNNSFMKKQIIGANINANKEFLLQTRMGNQVIEFGELEHIQTKIKKLVAFYQKAIKDKTLKNYNKINLKFKNQVVCTKRVEKAK